MEDMDRILHKLLISMQLNCSIVANVITSLVNALLFR